MNKQQYLSDNSVAAFMKELSELIGGKKFEKSHKYIIREKARNDGSWYEFNGRTTEWQCDTLQEAFQKYFWKNYSFIKTKEKLDYLANKLAQTIKDNQENDFLCVCLEVLDWGGTKNGIQGFVDKFCEGNLISNTQQAAEKLACDEPDFSDFNADGNYTINASYSKVYSLLVNNFVIYDSRVASALYLLAYNCFQKNIPKTLDFKSTSESKGKNNRVGMAPDKYLAQWNARANWILTAALEKVEKYSWIYPGTNTIVDLNDRLRALEAALFMIGYNIGDAAP